MIIRAWSRRDVIGDRASGHMATDTSTSDERTGEPLSVAELARIAADVLDASPLPALVLEIPSECIVASSLRAAQLLDPTGGKVIGHTLEDFTGDAPPAGIDLFAGGRLNGFETMRVLRRRRGADLSVRMWIRNFNHQPSSRYVLVVVVAAGARLGADEPTGWPEDSPAVMGTTNSSLLIERMSSDAESLFGRSASDLLGTSVLGLVAEQDMAACLSGLAEASASHRGVTLNLVIRNPAGPVPDSLQCEVLLLPLEPAPSCAFVFLPTTIGVSGIAVSDDLSAILGRLSRGAQIAELARGVFRGISERDVPGLINLTTRELEIVTSLLEGDRPPGIAHNLVLSQSTVRNHLASVFAKVGVNSQQELIDLFRAAHAADDRS
jgi:DNA-binding CsgD family transcriptional regulator